MSDENTKKPIEKKLTEDKKKKSGDVTNAIGDLDDLVKTAESNPSSEAISELKKKIEELKKKRTEEEEADGKIEGQMTKIAEMREKSKAEVDAITKGFSSKARTELLVDPSEVAFGASFHDMLKEDTNLLHNLIDLDWQLHSKFIEWKKAYRHYSVFSTVLTIIILICTSLVVVFEVLSTVSYDGSGDGDSDDSVGGNATADGRRRLESEPYVREKQARAIVAFLAFIATVFTGWLSRAVWKSTSELGYASSRRRHGDHRRVDGVESPRRRSYGSTSRRRRGTPEVLFPHRSYSKAEGKAALLGENQKTVRALQTRVRVLTKHHVPGTISVGNAAIEIDRIKQEQMRVQENVALIYNFQDWGTYSCCFKKCCKKCCEKKPKPSEKPKPAELKEQLEKLDAIKASRDKGSLTAAEFEEQKQKILREPGEEIETKETRNMKKWFKEMYYDKKYQAATDDYAKILEKGKNWGTEYTGKQEMGNYKKTTIEALEKELELYKTKLEALEAEKRLEEAPKIRDSLGQEKKADETVDELNSAERGEHTGGNA